MAWTRAIALCVVVSCGGATTSETAPTANVYTFAIHEFFLGETTRDTTVGSNSAWKTYGFNLDGKVTSASSTDVCALPANGAQLDGDDGIDNGFGATLVPIFATSGADLPTASPETTRQIQAGKWTFQIQIVGLSDDPAQTSSGLVARTFSSGAYSLGNVPAFDESTDWPVQSGTSTTFARASIADGEFTSGASDTPLTMSFVLHGVTLPLVLHAPIITFTHASRTDAIEGTIAGVLDVKELIASLKATAGHIALSLCGSAFDGIATQIAAAADILKDGTNRSGVLCDGISVGFGFNAKLIANPTMTTQVTPLTNPCAS